MCDFIPLVCGNPKVTREDEPDAHLAAGNPLTEPLKDSSLVITRSPEVSQNGSIATDMSVPSVFFAFFAFFLFVTVSRIGFQN